MRTSALLCLVLIACSSSPAPVAQEPETTSGEAPARTSAVPTVHRDVPVAVEQHAKDTPKTTVAGNTFIAPARWTIKVEGPATILSPPEGGSHIALVDVKARDADHALALAWAAYQPDHKRQVRLTTPRPDKDGWTGIKVIQYRTSPNEKRSVAASTHHANGMWLVVIYDMADDVGEKRGAQVGLIFDKLLPKGYERESFAGKKAHPLDAARIAELGRFVEAGMKAIGVPGVSIGLVQDGKVVFAGGFGVRQLGKAAKVDGDTRYLVASNTKALTTLMLGKLVDEKKMTWDTPATSLLPSFKLGDPDTTARVQVKHLICACTGMPRQDMEWLLEFGGRTPANLMTSLAAMQPTSKFGELFQYSNPLAAAAGFIGGHVAFPRLELGRAYDEAMRTRVFAPLGMKATTLDYRKARTGNFAAAHSPDIDFKMTRANDKVNEAIGPVRPAGGAWSTVRDMLRYVQMELDEGKLPGGKPYVSREVIMARRAPQVATGEDSTYGMGLSVETRYGVTVVHHGGDMIGYHSDMMWLPEHGVGAVVLTNGDGGWLIREFFRRKLLEVLFDGKPEADADLATAAKVMADDYAAERKLLAIPADPAAAGKLAAGYHNDALGDITVVRKGATVTFDFGEWKSEMATRADPDGTTSFVTVTPGLMGIPLVVGEAGGKRTLILRDAQHEYVFVEK